jgi:tetratricopeptide (TPR) repeat protein
MQNFWTEKKSLLIGAAICILLIAAGLVKGATKAPAPQAPVRAQQGVVENSEPLSTDEKVAEKREIERRSKALAAIADHEAAIQADWRSQDTPDRMVAIGNLYQYQIGDYYSAIASYRNLISHFPDHDKAAQAYVEIAACYERVGDETQARYVYQEMVDSLDPSLEHTKYAKLKLEGK